MDLRKDVRAGFGWMPALWCAVASTAVPADASRAAQPDDDLIVRKSRVTGLATFVTARDGGPIGTDAATATAAARPMSFLEQRGHLFGVTDPARELSHVRTVVDNLGLTHTTYQQVYQGVPVFSYQPISLSESIGRALPDLLVLALLNVVLLLWAYASFMRREVK